MNLINNKLLETAYLVLSIGDAPNEFRACYFICFTILHCFGDAGVDILKMPTKVK